MHHEVRLSAVPIKLPIDVCRIEILLSLRQACDVVAASLSVDHVLPSGRMIGSSKCRDQSVMMQPGRANVGTAMIAYGAEHPRLQFSIGHVVGKAANLDLSVVVTVRIAANDKHMFSAVTPHVG